MVAAALTFFPRLWWRHKVNVAIEATLEQGPDVHWAFNPLRDRFAENFFWDTAAWKHWWAERQEQ